MLPKLVFIDDKELLFPIRSFKNVNDTLSQIDAVIDDFEKNPLTLDEEFALEDAIDSCIHLKKRLLKILKEKQQKKEGPACQ
ncbi:MAG: hypothetical protein ACFFDW_12090 [Candidatus Thorarchaeota archaeon]